MKKAILIIILGLMWCNVGFAKDLTGKQIKCRHFHNDKDEPGKRQFMGFKFVSDEIVERYLALGFNFIDKTLYKYNVSTGTISIVAVEEGTRPYHYVLDRASLVIFRWGCEMVDDSINLKEEIESFAEENIKIQESKNQL